MGSSSSLWGHGKILDLALGFQLLDVQDSSSVRHRIDLQSLLSNDGNEGTMLTCLGFV